MLGAALACRGAETARFVFCSRHGDLARTATILAALARNEVPSPTEFSMSVHHAWAGLLSIHTGNRRGHAALAAGPDSFGFGFLEAAVCALDEPETPVLLVYFDDLPPTDFDGLDLDRGNAQPLVLSLLMERASPARASSFAVAPAGAQSSAPEADAPAHAFLRFLLNENRTSVEAAGERMRWRWSRSMAAC